MNFSVGQEVEIGVFNHILIDGHPGSENLVADSTVWLPILAMNSQNHEYCIAVVNRNLPAWVIAKDSGRLPEYWNNYWKGDTGPTEKEIGQRAWIVKESAIIASRFGPQATYGGFCRKCTDYNPYAECDGEGKFTCYRCKVG